MIEMHIPENVKLWESPGRAGGLPKCKLIVWVIWTLEFGIYLGFEIWDLEFRPPNLLD